MFWTLPPAAFAALLVVVATARWGAGLSPDSVAYISAARSVVAGDGLVSYTGDPFAHWPPLYPLIIAGGLYAGLDVVTTAGIAHALIFGLIVLASARVFALDVRSPWLVLLGAWMVALATPLLQVAVMVWSELLFILFLVLTTYWLRRAAAEARPIPLRAATAFAALATLQRYTGLVVVGLGVCFLLVEGRGPLRRRVGRALGFGVVATAPLALWVLRNLVVTSTASGARSHARVGIGENLARAADVVTGWLLPPRLASLRVVALVLAVAGTVALLRLVPRARRDDPERWTRRLAPPAIAAVAYAVAVAGSLSIVSADQMGTRLLAPIYPWLVSAMLVVLDELRSRPLARRRPVAVALMIVVAWWLSYQASRVARDTVAYAGEGPGAYRRVWGTPSPTLEWLRVSGIAGRLYSNAPDAIYLFTGRRGAFATELLEGGPGAATSDPRHLVWFQRGEPRALDDLDGAYPRLALEEIARFEDGVVFRVR